MCKRSVTLALFWLAGTAAPLSGQTLKGRIIGIDSVPAAGIVITAIGADGKPVANTISNAAGDYVLRVPVPGVYDLRVHRIGYRPSVMRGVRVGNSIEDRNMVLDPLPVAIAGMKVRDRADCDLSGQDAETFLQVWEQARGALSAVQLTEQGGSLDVHLVRIDGKVDAVHYYAPEIVGASEPTMDVLHAREWLADRVFASTPPETLETLGYIHAREDGSAVFDAPSPEVLLSDRFLENHCFAVVKATVEKPHWIGVAFSPRVERDGLVDISGVLWLDRSTAELRRFEFKYTNLPRARYQLCEEQPRDLENRVCSSFEEKGFNKFGIGGDADFQRLATGEWLTTRWTIRSLSNEMNLRPSPRKVRHLYPREACSDRVKAGVPRPGDCVFVLWNVPRLLLTSTSVARLVRSGVELYRNDSSLALIERSATIAAGKRPANLEGLIVNSAGRPLNNAIVQTERPSRVAITDSLGAFRIRMLPSDSMTISVRCRGYLPVIFGLRLFPDSTRRLSGTLIADSTSARLSEDCSSRD